MTLFAKAQVCKCQQALELLTELQATLASFRGELRAIKLADEKPKKKAAPKPVELGCACEGDSYCGECRAEAQ